MRRVYRVPSLELSSLVQALAHWFEAQDREVRIAHLSGDRALLRVRQREPWDVVLGISSVLQVHLYRHNHRLEVRVGVGRRIDKERAADLGAIFFWSLLFTAAWRAWHREQWPERTFAFIEHYLATGAPLPPAVRP